MFRNRQKPKKHRIWIKLLIALLIIAGVLAGVYYVLTHYKIQTVYVDGNVHYTNDEIMAIVMEGTLGDNSLYLSLKYKDKGVDNIPFVDKMDVQVISADTIRITVYEKSLAGYVDFLGRFMYFDRDGTVIESSEVRTIGIPEICGLQFDYIVLEEELPVEDAEIFSLILRITQLLEKYELLADKIYFDNQKHMTIYFGEVKVSAGAEDGIEEKIMILPGILENLEGKAGTLKMENYSETSKNITFEPEDGKN